MDSASQAASGLHRAYSVLRVALGYAAVLPKHAQLRGGSQDWTPLQTHGTREQNQEWNRNQVAATPKTSFASVIVSTLVFREVQKDSTPTSVEDICAMEEEQS